MSLKKKGQEEMVGFVLIILVVVVGILVFTGILLRSDSTDEQESLEISQFLESSMEFTTECALGYEPNYLKLKKLIVTCREGSRICTSGEDPCQVLNKTMSEIIGKSFPVKREIKGYEFISIYRTNSSEEEIISLSEGNCTLDIRGSEAILPADIGIITNTMKVCY